MLLAERGGHHAAYLERASLGRRDKYAERWQWDVTSLQGASGKLPIADKQKIRTAEGKLPRQLSWTDVGYLAALAKWESQLGEGHAPRITFLNLVASQCTSSSEG